MAAEPWETTPQIRRRMQATRSSGTRLELRMRRALTDAGVRYQLQRKPEPDIRYRADFLFVGARMVLDVRGCYWHACPEHTKWPKTNVSRWNEKLKGNRARDLRVEEQLSARGWLVLVVWEHDNIEAAARQVKSTLTARLGT